ncbi:hypothetical protein [Burkholderia plantarii]|uniref:hypothetical protein n=1 Tax=Burkholderia plantarii TaxID=41899 RepID=UPI0011E045EC|nr:hypothetical protein [Burkholderia plantarii]WLE58445.1 hypothetical protein GIY62_15095 [Burkholderia plantarii]
MLLPSLPSIIDGLPTRTTRRLARDCVGTVYDEQDFLDIPSNILQAIVALEPQTPGRSWGGEDFFSWQGNDMAKCRSTEIQPLLCRSGAAFFVPHQCYTPSNV